MKTLLLIVVSLLGTCLGQLSYVCPSSWLSQGDRCYHFVYDPLPYDEATQACQMDGASLLTVETTQEHQFITTQLRSQDMGRHDWYTSGERNPMSTAEYFWTSTGEKVYLDTTMWISPVEPITGEGSIIVYKFSHNVGQFLLGLVEDRDYERPFICEISRNEVYRINTYARDFDYGTSYSDANLVPRGPVWVFVAEPTIILGQTSMVYLECIAQATPLATYKWMRNNTEITSQMDSRYTLTNGRLTIDNPLEKSDAGMYQCSAENTQGRILGPPTQLSFAVLGDFSNVNTAPVTPKEYQGAVIECPKIQSGLSQAVRYQWLKEKYDSYSVAEFVRPELNTYIFISGNGKLYFSEVTSADNGIYYCVATLTNLAASTNYIGASQQPSRTSKGVQLNVISSSAGWYSPDIQDSFINVVPGQPIQGMDVSLECFAYGTAPLQYIWTVPRWDDYRYNLTDSDRVLKIKNVNVDDSGHYKCRVQRTQGQQTFDEKEFYFQVESKPEFILELQHQHLDVGTRQLTWRCEARAVPFPTYTWYKDGEPLLNSTDGAVRVIRNTLIITNLDKSRDEGMYQCSASNPHGTTFTTAQLRIISVEPSFAKNPMTPSLGGAVGGNITIPCQPEAAPFPTYTWLFNGGQLSVGEPGDINARIRRLLNGDLLVTSLSMGDQGVFTCRVENELGQAQSQTYLNIYTQTTIFQSPQNTLVEVNRTAFLSCAASFNQHQLDLTYQWAFNGRIIDIDNNVHYQRGNPPQNEGGLYLTQAQFYHTGMYTCIARTQVDSAEGSAMLTVIGPPSEPAGVQAYSAGETATAGDNLMGARDILLRWTEPVDNHGDAIESYMIYGKTNYSTVWQVLYSFVPQPVTVYDTGTTGNGMRRQFHIQNLKPGVSYQFKLRAVNRFGVGIASIPTRFVAIPGAPPARPPDNIGGGGGKVGTLRMTWTPLPPEDHGAAGIGYICQWRLKPPPGQTNSNAKWTEARVNGNVGEYSHTVGKEFYYTLFEVRVAAFNRLGDGVFGYNSSVYAAEEMPIAVPGGVYAQPFNESALIVYWKPISDDRLTMKGRLKGYKIAYWLKDVETQADAIQSIIYGATDHGMVIGLQPDTWYTVAVMVFNNAGNGPKSEIYHQSTDRYAPLMYPINVEVYPAGPNSVRVIFRGLSTGTFEEPLLGYKLRFWKDSDDIRNAKDVDCEKRTEGYINTVQQQTLYHLRVLGYSQGGDGKMSSPATLFSVMGQRVLQVSVDPTTSEIKYVYHDQSSAGGLVATSLTVLIGVLAVVFLQ